MKINKKDFNLGKVLLYTLLCSVILFLLAFSLRYRLVFGLGDSMYPTYQSKTLLLCKRTKDVVVDDVILFKISGKSAVHRIITKYENGSLVWYTTKGDGNAKQDLLPVTREHISCKVVKKLIEF